MWILICVTAGQNGLREWLIGCGFLVLAGARLATGVLVRRRPEAHALHLAATLSVMIVSMAAWGCVTAFALIHPDYAATPTVILFATSAFITAFVHSYPMRLKPAVAGLLAGYGPPFAALLIADRPGALAIAVGVAIHFSYLLLAARRAHYEYHRSIDLEQQLRAQRDLFSRRSRNDGLTELANRREFSEQLAAAIDESRVQGTPLSLLIIDLDHFKAVNDEHGHAAGDHCLVAIAGRLRNAFSAVGELPARLGGEEFAVLLPGSELPHAQARAETLRASLAANPLAIEGADVALTASIGVGAFCPESHHDPDALYRAVDGALYQAKHEGRNRVRVVAGDGRPSAPVAAA